MSFEGHFFTYLAGGLILVIAIVNAQRLVKVLP